MTAIAGAASRSDQALRFIFSADGVLLLNPLSYEILVYSSTMVFKNRINILGQELGRSHLEIHPIGASSLLLYEYNLESPA